MNSILDQQRDNRDFGITPANLSFKINDKEIWMDFELWRIEKIFFENIERSGTELDYKNRLIAEGLYERWYIETSKKIYIPTPIIIEQIIGYH